MTNIYEGKPSDGRQRADYDHHSPTHVRNWPAEFAQMRQFSPRAWTESHGGFWVATKYQDVIAIAQRPDRFSAHKDYDPETGAVSGGVSIPPLPGVRGIPNETASPEWDLLRGFINRRFSPRAVEAFRDKARLFTAALLDEVIETGSMDLVDQLTNPLPALVSMELFGFPLSDWRKFADPFHKIIYSTQDDSDFAETVLSIDRFREAVDEEVELRRREPRDDLLSHFAHGKIDGLPVDKETIRNLAFNLMVGGVDTTTALTSNALLYLGQHPEDRTRLAADRNLIPIAREEFVRYFSPIHGLARNVTDDVELDGWRFRKGERVMLAYAAANRDPEIFDDPDKVILNRFPNRHIGFGAGMHRCVGSFLARLMFEEMINAVLDRIPDYRIDDENCLAYPSIAIVNGWISIPARFTPGPRVGARIS
jgi:cytochrome P450